MIWPLYAALLAMLFVVLAARTIRIRQRLRVSLGHGRHPQLLRAIRAHGNAAEYMPLGVLLVAACEQLSAPAPVVHGLGSLLLLGRLVHALGVSREDEVLAFRVTGMTLTFACYLAATGLILWRTLAGNA